MSSIGDVYMCLYQDSYTPSTLHYQSYFWHPPFCLLKIDLSLTTILTCGQWFQCSFSLFFKLLNGKLRSYNFLFSYFPFIKYLRYSHSNHCSFLCNRHICFQKYCYSVSDNSNYIYMHNLSLETCWKTKVGPFISLI